MRVILEHPCGADAADRMVSTDVFAAAAEFAVHGADIVPEAEPPTCAPLLLLLRHQHERTRPSDAEQTATATVDGAGSGRAQEGGRPRPLTSPPLLLGQQLIALCSLLLSQCLGESLPRGGRGCFTPYKTHTIRGVRLPTVFRRTRAAGYPPDPLPPKNRAVFGGNKVSYRPQNAPKTAPNRAVFLIVKVVQYIF
jgi:hypothetical protein